MLYRRVRRGAEHYRIGLADFELMGEKDVRLGPVDLLFRNELVKMNRSGEQATACAALVGNRDNAFGGHQDVSRVALSSHRRQRVDSGGVRASKGKAFALDFARRQRA